MCRGSSPSKQCLPRKALMRTLFLTSSTHHNHSRTESLTLVFLSSRKGRARGPVLASGADVERLLLPLQQLLALAAGYNCTNQRCCCYYD